MIISRIIMGNESWIYGYDPETKQQSSQWKSLQSSRANKVQQVWSFFDVKGIVHRGFVLPNTMVNYDFYLYCDVLKTPERKCVTKKNKKKQNFGATTTCSFIMTMCPATRP
jgi:hypothetical protein